MQQVILDANYEMLSGFGSSCYETHQCLKGFLCLASFYFAAARLDNSQKSPLPVFFHFCYPFTCPTQPV